MNSHALYIMKTTERERERERQRERERETETDLDLVMINHNIYSHLVYRAYACNKAIIAK